MPAMPWTGRILGKAASSPQFPSGDGSHGPMRPVPSKARHIDRLPGLSPLGVSMSLTRRQFLQYGAGVVAGATVTQGIRIFTTAVRTMDALEGPPARAYSHPEWVEGFCDRCASLCTFQFRRVDGRLVGVRPTPRSPCAWAYVLPQTMRHPDRVDDVLQANERGSGSWKGVPPLMAVEALAALLREAPQRTAWVFPKASASLGYQLWRAMAHVLGCAVFIDSCPLI